MPPSSVGFSCYVRGNVRLAITASAAIYQDAGERDPEGRFLSQEYTRTRLPETTVTWSGAAISGQADQPIWEGRAAVDVRARPHGDGLHPHRHPVQSGRVESEYTGAPRTRNRVSKSLFEARLECAVESGELVEYPRVDPSLLTEEERELELQYRERRIYAIGHGAAASWEVGSRGEARIWSDFMPETEVPMMTVDTDDADRALDLSYLADSPRTDDLARFAEGYADWIAEQRRAAAGLRTQGEMATAERICARMSTALVRMRRCVEMLRTDPLAAESFRCANRAMLDQMRQANRVDGKEVGAPPVASLPVGLPAHGHGVRNPGRRRLPGCA